jgi:hypothetical protein
MLSLFDFMNKPGAFVNEPSPSPEPTNPARGKPAMLDGQILDYLREQSRSVTITQIASPPKNGEPKIGDFEDVGGLGIVVAAVRASLLRLEQAGHVQRLDPIRGTCSHLYVALTNAPDHQPVRRSPWKR